MNQTIQLSVIISTYNEPQWLDKVLFGFQCQTLQAHEIIIADDGSNDETRHLIAEWQNKANFTIKHVWHEDKGFRKTIILNKAIQSATGNYVIFTDGDCIPRQDFLATHQQHAKPGYFLSGGYFKLPMTTSHHIEHGDIENGNAFNVDWLLENGLGSRRKTGKITAQGWKQRLLNHLTPTKATWNGHNASGWLDDIKAANGFDERMQYGGEDRELGERLTNAGIKSRQIRYSAVVIHLDHARGYVKPEMILHNNAIRRETRKLKRIKTPFGINYFKESKTNANLENTPQPRLSV